MNHDALLPLPEALLERMDATQQNPRYHREGSVLAHTDYVVRQCVAMQDRFDLNADERLVLYWAAVLHDIGKTVATVWQDNRWRSPGHERAGVPLALDILLGRPEISPEMRHRILEIVRWHGFPLKFSQYQEPIDRLKLLGTRTDLKLLGIFGLFDFYGRDCDDKVDVLERMHHFQEVSVPQAEFELGRYGELQTAYGQWNLRHKNAVWNAFKMKDVQLLEKLVNAAQKDAPETRGQTATVVIGSALAGKSTWIAKNLPERFVINLEEHGVTNDLTQNSYLLSRKLVEIKHFLRVYLNRHQHLVIETRPLVEEIRRPFGEILRDMPVELDYMVLEARTKDLEERRLLAADAHSTVSAEPAMELIHPWEAHRMVYVNA